MPRLTFRSIAPLAVVLAVALGTCAVDSDSLTGRRRAILVSFDGFNPIRFRATLDSATIPAFTRLFREGACAPYVLTQWATQTPIAHAAIWTGAFSHINGVGRHEAALPETAWSWLDPRPPSSLYLAPHLAAEPLWITAARQGRSVIAHHPTHAPQPPGYRDLGYGVNDGEIEEWTAEAVRVLARTDVAVMNGYNRRHATRTITDSTHTVREPAGWLGADGIQAIGEVAWNAGPDSLFALITADRAMLVADTRDLSRAITVLPAPARPASIPPDTSATGFAGPVVLRDGDTPTAVYLRLFELDVPTRRFTLHQTGAEVIEANRPEVTEEYVAATGGWIGNAYGTGLGPWLGRGGDGTTELRQLEVNALLTRQWLRGTRWAWNRDPDLLIDYNPSADSYDHQWYGWIARDRPGYDADIDARIRDVRDAAYSLLDQHLDLLMRYADDDPSTMLFVTSDHGMRPVWQTAHPNAILARAGLLAVDERGAIDLSRTQALSPDGWGIVVNRATRKLGIVRAEDADSIVALARAALESAHAPDGSPLVRRVYTRAELDSLFGSGPGANDLYVNWRPGIRGDRDVLFNTAGEPIQLQPLATPVCDHGATLPHEEGLAGFCVYGAAVRADTLPIMRQTDVAPSVADWLGMDPPRQATGRSVVRRRRGNG